MDRPFFAATGMSRHPSGSGAAPASVVGCHIGSFTGTDLFPDPLACTARVVRAPAARRKPGSAGSAGTNVRESVRRGSRTRHPRRYAVSKFMDVHHGMVGITADELREAHNA